MNFNLLVTTYRHREYDAVDELNLLLKRFGDESSIIKIQDVSGLILAFKSV